MQGKITLITPPDLFENDSQSVLFVNLDVKDQEAVSAWLAKSELDKDINIYFYDNGDAPWLLYALARCNYSILNLDQQNEITKVLAGYILGKKNIFYKTENENTAAICHYINQNRITNIELFLERVFNDKI